VLEPLFLARRPQARAFSSPYLIDGLVQVRRNVKAIEHVQRLTRLFGNDPKYGFHISKQTKRKPFTTSGPSAAQPFFSVAWVRRCPTHSSRRQPLSIW
jgi:hypothetical protein